MNFKFFLKKYFPETKDHIISEKIKIDFDISAIKNHLSSNVLPLPPMMVSESFGGWSVYSSNGNYQDGWAKGQLIYDENFMPGSTIEEKAIHLGIKRSSEYVIETEICTGPLRDLMNLIKSYGLSPRRARLSLLKANSASSLHQDAPHDVYSVRLHIPILTNDQCYFLAKGAKEHFPADGKTAYFIFVNRPHQVVNHGLSDRIHLIMDVTDNSNFTQFHRKY